MDNVENLKSKGPPAGDRPHAHRRTALPEQAELGQRRGIEKGHELAGGQSRRGNRTKLAKRITDLVTTRIGEEIVKKALVDAGGGPARFHRVQSAAPGRERGPMRSRA